MVYSRSPDRNDVHSRVLTKRSERRKHCARAGCSKVRTPPARPPARYKHMYTQTDRTDYNTLRR